MDQAAYKRVLNKIGLLPKRVRTEASASLLDAAQEIVMKAKRDAPADQGFLRNSISVVKHNDLSYETVVNSDYAAFVEFGTRGKARIPPGLEKYASQFRGRGDALSAKQMIFEWCRRKGIDEKAWYAIYISLMVEGVTPHPFFFKHVAAAKQKASTGIKLRMKKIA